MFNGVKMVIISTWMILLRDDGAGHEVVQKNLQGSGGDGWGLERVQATAVELKIEKLYQLKMKQTEFMAQKYIQNKN